MKSILLSMAFIGLTGFTGNMEHTANVTVSLQPNSRYCKNCLMHTGTKIDSNGRVTDKNYQFKLSETGTLRIQVNVFDAQNKQLGFSKARIVVRLKDAKMNDLGITHDFTLDQIKPSGTGFSFYFDVDRQGLYHIEVQDENNDWMNSTNVVVMK